MNNIYLVWLWYVILIRLVINSRQRSSPSTSGNFRTLEAIRSWWRQVVLHCYALLPRWYSVKSKLKRPWNLQTSSKVKWSGRVSCAVLQKLKRRKPVSHSFQSALSTSPVRLQRPWRLLVRKGGAMQLWAVCSMRNGPTCAALLCSILLIIPNPGQMWDAMSLAFCNSKGQRESLINHCLLKSMEHCSRSFDDMSRHHFLVMHMTCIGTKFV